MARVPADGHRVRAPHAPVMAAVISMRRGGPTRPPGPGPMATDRDPGPRDRRLLELPRPGRRAERAVRPAYPDATHERLVAVKRRVDPANVFRGNHNIPPRLTVPRRSPASIATPAGHRRGRIRSRAAPESADLHRNERLTKATSPVHPPALKPKASWCRRPYPASPMPETQPSPQEPDDRPQPQSDRRPGRPPAPPAPPSRTACRPSGPRGRPAASTVPPWPPWRQPRARGGREALAPCAILVPVLADRHVFGGVAAGASGTLRRGGGPSPTARAGTGDPEPSSTSSRRRGRTIHDNYVDAKNLDNQELAYGAIRGLAEAVGDEGHTLVPHGRGGKGGRPVAVAERSWASASRSTRTTRAARSSTPGHPQHARLRGRHQARRPDHGRGREDDRPARRSTRPCRASGAPRART